MHPGHDSTAIRLVSKFLYSNLSILLIVLSILLGAAALMITPREEEPQIVVPLADVLVNFPGRSAEVPPYTRPSGPLTSEVMAVCP